tara:strand:- start:231 stop:644 length:414 start_codon:yes stop_codon:yes gene_type:complete
LSNNISDKDKKDWQKFISNSDKLPDKDSVVENKIYQKIRSIDLHGYTLNEANKKIEQFINKAHKEKINKLIVVTGKGLHSQNEKDPYVSKDLSMLKYSVPEFIRNNSALMRNINTIQNASVEDGGSGAFYIYLKKIK